MRLTLQTARNEAEKTQVDMAKFLKLSTRHYQRIEAGECEAKPKLWDTLEEFFAFKYSQRELRYNHPPDASVPCRPRKRNRKAA